MHILRTSIAAAATALVAVGLVAAPATSAPSDAATVTRAAHPAAAQRDTTSVAVTPSGGGSLRPGQDLGLSVTVTNDTDADVPAGTADLTIIRTRIAGRDELSDWLADTSTTGYAGYRMQEVDVPAVPAHRSVTVSSITVPAAEVGLDPGVNPLGARRIAATYDAGSTTARSRSAVTWNPGTTDTPLGVSVAMPVTLPASADALTKQGLLTSQTLAAATALDGTLTQQLDAAARHNVALAIDPRVIASIRALGVDAPSSATAWLQRLEEVGNETFALPWADADLAGLRQAGSAVLAPISLDQTIDPDHFPGATTPSPTTPSPSDTATPTDRPTDGAAATDRATSPADAAESDRSGSGNQSGSDGRAGDGGSGSSGDTTADDQTPTELPTTKTLLDFPYSLTGIAWPSDGTVSADDLPALAAAGWTRTIVSSGNTSAGADSTVAASERIGGQSTLVADQTASSLLRKAATAKTDLAWASAMSDLDATLVTSAGQADGISTPMLLTLGRSWPSDSSRLAQTLDTLERASWLSPTDLSTTVSANPGSLSLAAGSDSADRLDQLRRLVAAEKTTTDFSTAMSTPQDLTAPTRLAVLSAASNGWRAEPSGFVKAVDTVVARATSVSSSVGIVKPSDLTLLSDRSSLPIQVSNGSDYPVTVLLTVQPSSSVLQVERNAIEVSIQKDSSSRVTVPVQSVANGKVQVSLSLTSASGVPIATPSTVELNVQAQWETIITGVAGAALVLVFGAGIVRNIRRRRRRLRGEELDDEPDPNRPVDVPAAAAVAGSADAAALVDAGVRPGGHAAVPASATTTSVVAPGTATAGAAAAVGAAAAPADAEGDRLADAIARAGAGHGLPADGDETDRTDPREPTISAAQPQPDVDAEPVAERSLGRASAMLAAGTMVSRVLGFAKTIILAYAIGQQQSLSADAFAVSNQLPNNIYALIAGGLLSAVLIPQIVRSMRQHTDGGTAYVNKIVTLGGTVFVVIAAVATVLAPLLVRLYSQSAGTGGKGFTDAQTDLAVAFAFWCLPQILFYALYSLLGEVLNAKQVFGPFTWAPLVNNVIAVGGLVVFMALYGDRSVNAGLDDWTPAKIAVLAGSASLGVFAQAAFLPFFWRRAGLTYRPDFRWKGVGLKSTGTAAGWLFAMILVTQLAGLVQSRVSSLGTGAAGNAVLQNAWLLFMLPHSIITVSIATAYFTRMSHDAERGDLAAVRRNLSLSLRIVGLFTVFASVALMVVSVPFGRVFSGTFAGSLSIGAVLLAYMPGLVLFSMLFIIQRVFWAMHDHRTPFFMQCVQSGLFVVGALAVSLLPGQAIGFAIAACTTIAGSAQTVVALVLVRKRLGGIEGPNVTRSHVQFVVAAVIAGAAGLVVTNFFGAFSASGFAMSDATGAVITIVLSGAVMVLVYLGVLVVARNQEIRGAVDMVKARLGR